MTLDEFWHLTPREFANVVAGRRDRDEEQARLMATHACIIANVWLPRGKRLKPDDIVGSSKELPVFMDADSFRSYMRDRIAKAKEPSNG